MASCTSSVSLLLRNVPQALLLAKHSRPSLPPALLLEATTFVGGSGDRVRSLSSNSRNGDDHRNDNNKLKEQQQQRQQQPRLRRPTSLRDRRRVEQDRKRNNAAGGRSQQQQRRHSVDGNRPHTITLFPGDFGDYDDDDDSDDDDDGYENWLNGGSANSDQGVFHSQDDDEQEEAAAFIRELKRREKEQAALKEKWLKNAEPPHRQSQIDSRGRAYGRGGRKTASAAVWIQPSSAAGTATTTAAAAAGGGGGGGGGEIVVNRRPLVEYFERQSDRELVLAPLVATETCGLFDVQCNVRGGGLTGQAGALQHGLARALNNYDPHRYRPALKRLGYLTRDARQVERKKVGHVKARKSPQWVRR